MRETLTRYSSVFPLPEQQQPRDEFQPRLRRRTQSHGDDKRDLLDRCSKPAVTTMRKKFPPRTSPFEAAEGFEDAVGERGVAVMSMDAELYFFWKEVIR